MNYKILLVVILFFVTVGSFTLAQDTSTSTAILIEQLKQQITNLQAQITQLQEQLKIIQGLKKEIKETTLELKNQLRQGMTGDDIRLLQEFLATDPEIYPEGLITGYFGQLTRKAVERFQKKTCLPQMGIVGPTTLWKINELLTEGGVGKSGKIPPGLLKAPGILKKLCATSSPATTTSDTVAPIIFDVSATSTSSSTAQVNWKTNEKSNSKVYYSTVTPIDLASVSTLSVSNSDLVENHSLNLSNLTANTTYYYFVVSFDKAENIATSTENSFATLP